MLTVNSQSTMLYLFHTIKYDSQPIVLVMDMIKMITRSIQ
jgi:hypothetical protein